MPHNRTRIWVGLAIAAITIPAVGEYYVHSGDSSLTGSNVSRAARLPAEGGDSSPNEGVLANLRRKQDYIGEVNAALARSGNVSVPIAGSDDDPTFDVSPYASEDDGAYEPNTDAPATSNDSSYPVATLAPEATLTPNVDPGPSDDAPPAAIDLSDDSVDGGPSDAAVYAFIVNNLSADKRDDFVRNFSSMTIDQQQNLLDNGRVQMQGGNGQ